METSKIIGIFMRENTTRIRNAVKLLDSMKLDFEYDGEMSADAIG